MLRSLLLLTLSTLSIAASGQLLILNGPNAVSGGGGGGALQDGDSVEFTISGAGTKSPATPLLYFDFEDIAVSTSYTHGDTITGAALSGNITYSEVGPSADGTMPASVVNTGLRASTSATRALYMDATAGAGDWAVRVLYNISPALTQGDNVYYYFWIRQDMPVSEDGAAFNQKPMEFYNGSFIDQIYTGFADSVGGFRSGGSATEDALFANSLGYDSHQNGNWLAYEEELYLDTTASGNGSRRAWTHRETPAIVLEWSNFSHGTWQDSGDNLANWAVGEFFRTAAGNAQAEYWLEMGYLDDTLQRAMLCNASTRAASTRCEVQVATAWSGDTVTVTLRQGGIDLSTTTGYMCVVGADGSDVGCTAIN